MAIHGEQVFLDPVEAKRLCDIRNEEDAVKAWKVYRVEGTIVAECRE